MNIEILALVILALEAMDLTMEEGAMGSKIPRWHCGGDITYEGKEGSTM